MLISELFLSVENQDYGLTELATLKRKLKSPSK